MVAPCVLVLFEASFHRVRSPVHARRPSPAAGGDVLGVGFARSGCNAEHPRDLQHGGHHKLLSATPPTLRRPRRLQSRRKQDFGKNKSLIHVKREKKNKRNICSRPQASAVTTYATLRHPDTSVLPAIRAAPRPFYLGSMRCNTRLHRRSLAAGTLQVGQASVAA